MRIHTYVGLDFDRFREANPHMRVVKKKISGSGLDWFDVIEVGSTQDVEQNAVEASVEDRLTRLEHDFYNHSHMRDTGDNPCAGEIILKWPKELRK